MSDPWTDYMIRSAQQGDAIVWWLRVCAVAMMFNVAMGAVRWVLKGR